MCRSLTFAFWLLFLCAMGARADSTAQSVLSDPIRDVAHPARIEVVHIPTHGVKVNGVFYLASGAGAHPTMIFLHGMPGNEQNLDLAQAVRRLGWNVLTFHPRGSWGSPGQYSHAHVIEDGLAALAFVRDPKVAERYSVNRQTIVVAGHSTGGFAAPNIVARAAPVAGMVLVSGADEAAEASAARKSPAAWRAFVAEYEEMEGLVGCTPRSVTEELLHHEKDWSYAALAQKIANVPALIVTANDGYAEVGQSLADRMNATGGRVEVVHIDTDHSYSDHRISLETTVTGWLGRQFPESLGSKP